MKKAQTLKQRRSLAAKRGWETRRKADAVVAEMMHDINRPYRERKKKLDAAWAGIAERAKTAPVVPCPEQVSYDQLPGQPFISAIDKANREREAQSKHPGSAQLNDHREYAPELLLTEGMRVKEKIGTRIRMLAARFVKRLGRGK